MRDEVIRLRPPVSSPGYLTVPAPLPHSTLAVALVPNIACPVLSLCANKALNARCFVAIHFSGTKVHNLATKNRS